MRGVVVMFLLFRIEVTFVAGDDEIPLRLYRYQEHGIIQSWPLHSQCRCLVSRVQLVVLSTTSNL